MSSMAGVMLEKNAGQHERLKTRFSYRLQSPPSQLEVCSIPRCHQCTSIAARNLIGSSKLHLAEGSSMVIELCLTTLATVSELTAMFVLRIRYAQQRAANFRTIDESTHKPLTGNSNS